MEETKIAYGPLRGVIVSRFGSLRAYADKYGYTPNQMHRMVSEGYKWRVDDAVITCNRLGIPTDQLTIFFSEKG